MAHTKRAIGLADFFTAGADSHAAQASNFVRALHATAPQLERQQAGEPAPAFLIKARDDPIDRLMFMGQSPIGMRLTRNALTMVSSTLRFGFAHGSGTTLAGLPAWVDLSLHQNGQVIL